MIITICSSVDFSPSIIEIKKKLEAMGHEVHIPYFTGKIMRGDISLREKQVTDMIRRYWDFIKNSDAILVLNLDKKGISNYIGGSTLIEMGFAYGHTKKIFLYNPIPERNEKMHYIDEIIDMDPIVINGKLDLLEKYFPTRT